ncbi:MAG: DUF2793 domain-containing protein [Sphingomonadaceae bacterium]|nr:DUF2793 domain-containing protein [Sphingomonadaceae bacterium]
MTDTTPRFALPQLLTGHAQKEIWHNEALALIDAVLHPVAESRGDNTPPANPAAGQCWITGSAPVGDWAGEADWLAIWTGAASGLSNLLQKCASGSSARGCLPAGRPPGGSMANSSPGY